MRSTPLVAVLLAYLVFLFLVAAVAERFGRRLMAPRLRTLTYVLAISVYCTAWTFYGSVGLAANRGLEFLTIYLGPALVALMWPTVLRKLVRVAKEQRITTISDFIASRYGKSASLGTLVAALVVCGMIPYIALQLKAVSVTFQMMIQEDSVLSGFDPALLVACTLALFGILFGARNLDFTRQQTGLMTAVAVESIVKLIAFLLVGAFVTWGLFDGFAAIFTADRRPSGMVGAVTLGDAPAASYDRWAAMLLISMVAVMFLPRQFHVLVVQNPHERDVHTAAWAFPLYLLAINVFVLPIAFAGLLTFGSQTAADSFILALPLHAGAELVAVIVFLGGFSAATAMIVVDSLALSKMISNDIVLPFILRRRHLEEVYWLGLASTRLGILVVVTPGLSLGPPRARPVPARRDGVALVHRRHPVRAGRAPRALLAARQPQGRAQTGISLGFALWFYTLIIPALVKEGVLPVSVLDEGPLRPLVAAARRRCWGWRASIPSATACSGHCSSTSAPTCWCRSPRLRTPTSAARRPPSWGAPPWSRRGRRPSSRCPRWSACSTSTCRPRRRTPSCASCWGARRPGSYRCRICSTCASAWSVCWPPRWAPPPPGTSSRTASRSPSRRRGQLVESFQTMQRSLRQSEQLLASVVESVDDCIFTTDVEGRLITVNLAGQRLLGLSAAAARPELP